MPARVLKYLPIGFRNHFGDDGLETLEHLCVIGVAAFGIFVVPVVLFLIGIGMLFSSPG